MRIIGIDPGTTGALAMLQAGTFVTADDMPVMARSKAKSSKKLQVNAAALTLLLSQWHPDAVVIELVNAMPRVGSKAGMGAASAFNFGASFGIVQGVVAALGLQAHYVTPQTWKKRAGLRGADKEASRMRAIQLWPAAAEALKCKKDAGRAEAMLIARFGVAEFDTDPVRADPFRLTQQAAS